MVNGGLTATKAFVIPGREHSERTRNPETHACVSGFRTASSLRSLGFRNDSVDESLRQIEKIPPCPVLDLDHPNVGIEFELAGDFRFRDGFRLEFLF